MKGSTERRLLLALLLTTQLPLLALGILSGLTVHRMNREATALEARSRADQVRSTLTAQAGEAAERVAGWLRASFDDLRTLSLVSPSAQRYAAFLGNTLGPVWVPDDAGVPARVWLPRYRAVACLNSDGAPLAEAPPGAAAVMGPRPVGGTPEKLAIEPHPGETTDLVLRYHPGGDRSWGAVLNASPLVATLDPPRPVGASRPEGQTRLILLWGPGQTPRVFPSDHPTLEEELAPVTKAARAGRWGVLDLQGSRYLAFAPIMVAPGKDLEPIPVGAVCLAGPVASATAGLPPPLTRVTGPLEVRIALLTGAAMLGIGVAAWLVAARMARPWVQLGQKARSMAPPVDDDGDDVAGIDRSLDTLVDRAAASDDLRRASERRFAEFFEMSPDGLAVISSDGHTLSSNRSLCQILRRSPEELRATPWAELVAPDGGWHELRNRLDGAGVLLNHEVEMIRGDGNHFPARVSLRLAEHRGDIRIEATIRDVTDALEARRRDREKTEALFKVYGELSQAHDALQHAYAGVEDQVREKTGELRAANDALRTADRVKTDFLMQMSHELRTPLNCIIGYSDAMIEGIDGPVSDDQASSLGRISKSGRRLLRLIENLLDLSRLEAGRLDIHPSVIRVEDAVADVHHQSRGLVDGKPIRLQIDLGTPLPSVRADPDRVRQVLFNLVGNAAKFTREGEIRIGANATGDRSVTLWVADTGPGIDPKDQETIFERFNRGSAGARSGAGLGLAICRQLVERMGGTIAVESEPNRGSTFRFTLPTATGPGQLSFQWPPEPGHGPV